MRENQALPRGVDFAKRAAFLDRVQQYDEAAHFYNQAVTHYKLAIASENTRLGIIEEKLKCG